MAVPSMAGTGMVFYFVSIPGERGIVMTVLVIASALGPLPFGAAFDFFGRYREILLVMALFPTTAVVASSLAPKPAYRTHS